MTTASDSGLRRMATLLGSAGLAPFIAFAGATWVDPAVLGEAFAGKLSTLR